MCYAPADGKANPPEAVPHEQAAWEWFRSLGSPKYWIAPMVDQSELPYRLLCLRHGATGGYTPMLHARIFLEKPHYRRDHFTTCPEDRPILAQFCGNDPDTVLQAARMVESQVDGIDLNLGCPQRIARKGNYGAFLMDDLPLVEEIVKTLATNLTVPVTVKIRRFDEVEDTVEYASMLERAGASLVAVHGRTREQKWADRVRADWSHIMAVKKALRVPVLGNGNIRSMYDVEECLAVTGVDGVLSAESLLDDPALFASERLLPGSEFKPIDGPKLCMEYLELCLKYPVPWRMMKGHAFKLLGPWLAEFVDLREYLSRGGADLCTTESLIEFTELVIKRIEETRRTYPVPVLSPKQLEELERAAAKQAAIAEQEREADALEGLVTPKAYSKC